jgi:hypothetical protein
MLLDIIYTFGHPVTNFFPLVYFATTSRWKMQFLTATSAAIAVLGFYWFVERAFLM